MVREEWTGIVLCGGQSRRMGKNKGLVEFNGETFVQRAVKILGQRCRSIMISSNSDAFDGYGYPVVKDLFQEIGPMGGISASLKASTTDINIVLSCDMPFVVPELYDHLFENLEKNLIAVPHYSGDHYEPMCGIYTKRCLAPMLEFIRSGNYKLPDFYRQVPFSPVGIPSQKPFYHPNLFFNVNSPQDLKEAVIIQKDLP